MKHMHTLPDTPTTRQATKAWDRAADRLAEWSLRYLVVRRDIWGSYWMDEWGKIHPVTLPRAELRPRNLLGPWLLARHYRARHLREIVGTHLLDLEGRCCQGGYDVDRHDERLSAEQTFAIAVDLYGRLVALGFSPLMTESDGKGGYHVRVILRGLVEGRNLRALLRRVAAESGHMVEVFPKQDRPDTGKKCGNYLRLPGPVKRCNGYARAWDELGWIEAEDVPAYLLSVRGDDPALVPPAPPPPKPPARRWAAVTSEGTCRAVLSYIGKMPAGKTSGQGRNDDGYRLACFCLNDKGLNDQAALTALELWNDRNAVPKSRAELEVLVRNARVYGRKGGGR